MTTFDIDGALRWARFDPNRSLVRRLDESLPFAFEAVVAGPPLLLDTCVYIDQMQGRAPELVDKLIEKRQINHSTVAIQELMHAVGMLRPDDKRTPKVVSVIRDQIKAMPAHRTFAPGSDTLGRAALLAGILCRLQGYYDDAKLKALHDCVLFLQAQKMGSTVLTRNIIDFDLMMQLLPTGRALLYRN